MADKYSQLAAYVRGYQDYRALKRMLDIYLRDVHRVCIVESGYDYYLLNLDDTGKIIDPPLYIGMSYIECLNWYLNKRPNEAHKVELTDDEFDQDTGLPVQRPGNTRHEIFNGIEWIPIKSMTSK